MANQPRNPQSQDQSGDSNRRPDENDQVRGIADEGDEAFEADEDELEDEDEEEGEEEGGTF